LINSDISDEDFWNEVEASDPRDNDSGGSSGGGKLICTAMNKMGLLPDDIYALDAEFGLKVNREDRMLGDGYRLWALPVSEYIKRDTIWREGAAHIHAAYYFGLGKRNGAQNASRGI
jgi:hypothetical protein